MRARTLKEIADHIGGKVVGDDGLLIKSASTLDKAGRGEITFLSNRKYEPLLKTTGAEAVILSDQAETKAAQIIAEDPYYAFMQVVVLLHGHREHKKVGISDNAYISESAKVAGGCDIHNFVTISDNASIGKNCVIYPGVFIGPNASVGEDCIIYPNAVIYDGCRVGDRVIIQSGAAIGQDGFGFATHGGKHHKIPQIGAVVIEDDVEIGACTVIERGTLDDTVIGRGCKIGDTVAIGHGTKVGAHCLMVPQVGIAGSAVLGDYCVLGGQAGVVGHIKIGNMVKIAAQAGVINDIPDGATVLGAPAIDANKARRAYALIETLPEMRKAIRRLSKKIEGTEQVFNTEAE